MKVEEHNVDIHTQTVTATMTKAEWIFIQRVCTYFQSRPSLVANALIRGNLDVPAVQSAIHRMFPGNVPKEFWAMTAEDFDKIGR